MPLAIALALLLIGVMASGPIKRYTASLFSGAWRPGAGTAGVACIIGGLFLMVRAIWGPGLILIAVGFGLLMTARGRFKGWPGFIRRPQAPPPRGSASGMSRIDAASILGVAVDADRSAVLSAHRRLIRMAHPDAGGTPGLAAQLNRARDVLLQG